MSTLNVTDVQSLQSALKGLTSQLKKFSLDTASIKQHAAEIIEAQEKEKAKKDREKQKKNFTFNVWKVEQFVDQLFGSFDEILDNEWGTDMIFSYDIEQYLADNHGSIVEQWRKKIQQFREDMKRDLLVLVPK